MVVGPVLRTKPSVCRRVEKDGFAVSDIKRWAKNRRKPPIISEQTASLAFGVVLENAEVLKIKSQCALRDHCKGRYCLAIHRLNRRDFMRCSYEAFLSIRRGGPVVAEVLTRYQQYLRHGGGRRA